MLSYELISDVQKYIDDNFTEEITPERVSPQAVFNCIEELCAEEASENELNDQADSALFGIDEDDEALEDTIEAASMLSFDMPMESRILSSEDSITDLKERLSQIDESFADMLVKKIDSLGMSDADCYKKAQLNRSHFNKIKNDPGYHVQKETVFALALALSLNKSDADAFLAKAGYAFSSGSRADLIIEYCINKGIYDVVEVNQLLYAFDQKLLGAGIRE